MLKKISAFIFIAILLAFPSFSSKANNYFSIGYNFALPTSDFNNVVSNASGVQLKLENRRFCNYWFGVNAEYFFIQNKENIVENVKNIFALSPNIKFLIFSKNNINDYKGNLAIYLSPGLTFSNIEGEDDLSPLGFGGYANIGSRYGFKMFERCASLDFNIKYNLPNFIFKDSDRETFQYIAIGLSLGICL
ncbi:MAG: hypothetical protein GX121_00295 [Ignavibacteria bacterium]|nr:hypothetical protein [Ignavibacteria bacterium]